MPSVCLLYPARLLLSPCPSIVFHGLMSLLLLMDVCPALPTPPLWSRSLPPVWQSDPLPQVSHLLPPTLRSSAVASRRTHSGVRCQPALSSLSPVHTLDDLLGLGSAICSPGSSCLSLPSSLGPFQPFPALAASECQCFSRRGLVPPSFLLVVSAGFTALMQWLTGLSFCSRPLPLRAKSGVGQLQ